MIAMIRTSFELGYHRDLSRRALHHLSRDARRLAVNANLFVDIRTACALLLRRRRDRLMRMHFDDCFSWSAFVERWRDVDNRLAELETPSPGELARALGEALHSGQDYYAHSNHVELVTEVEPSAFRPVTYHTVMESPEWRQLFDTWTVDRSGDVHTSLMSGAYVEPEPIVSDQRGDGSPLHHRTLHKDRPTISGTYLYPDFDRATMHFRAMACASLESQRLADMAASTHPKAWSELSDYRSSMPERVWESAKYGLAIVAGVVTGHWR